MCTGQLFECQAFVWYLDGATFSHVNDIPKSIKCKAIIDLLSASMEVKYNNIFNYDPNNETNSSSNVLDSSLAGFAVSENCLTQFYTCI